ncbi:hypothetical protein [Streptomyces sp. SP18CS02]|uniref:hypothetical protein n=1 Tax=Streptomyces sp. SP18CS02 TaxID=3002531 RepID=UPI002E762615|nr:hypothetical protein [Streptomyces sp. SP18CS02]MEE1756618.1 hypothetical protein [Streptomyces sp. SP18CS02]
MTSPPPDALTLARARSPEPPAPDFPAGRQVTAWPGEPLPVPPELDRTLRLSLAGGRLRPAASAGALHPVNTHLLLGPDGTLPPGRYAYDPVRHRLHPRGGAGADAPRGAIAVLTVTARRTVSHYGHRGWPLLLLDTGHAAAALALAGAATWCPDADGALLAAAAGLPRDWGDAEPEHALAAVRLTPGPPDAPTRWAAQGPARRPLPADRAAPPVLRETWRLLDQLTRTGSVRAAWRPVAVPVLPDEVLLGRRSAPPGFPGAPDRTEAGAVLAAARRAAGDRGLLWTMAAGPSAGRGGGAVPERIAAPPRGPGRPRGPGPAPDGLARRAAGQAWLSDTGAVLLAHGCPDDAGSARVRLDHLAAGYAVGAAQALACALGLASRPVGSWQHGSPGPRHIVHGLALGRRTEAGPGTEPRNRTRARHGPALRHRTEGDQRS